MNGCCGAIFSMSREENGRGGCVFLNQYFCDIGDKKSVVPVFIGINNGTFVDKITIVENRIAIVIARCGGEIAKLEFVNGISMDSSCFINVLIIGKR